MQLYTLQSYIHTEESIMMYQGSIAGVHAKAQGIDRGTCSRSRGV